MYLDAKVEPNQETFYHLLSILIRNGELGYASRVLRDDISSKNSRQHILHNLSLNDNINPNYLEVVKQKCQ